MGRDSDYNSPEYHPKISEAFRRFGDDFVKVSVTAPQNILAFAQAFTDMIRCVPEEHPYRHDIEQSLGHTIREIVNPTAGRKHGNALFAEETITDNLIMIEQGGDGPAAGHHWRDAEIIPMAPSQRLSQHFKNVADSSKTEVASAAFLEVAADPEVMTIYANFLIQDFMKAVPEGHGERRAIATTVNFQISSAFADMERMAQDGKTMDVLFGRFSRAVDSIVSSSEKYTAKDDPVVRASCFNKS